MNPTALFLLQAVAISLSGVMAPGPVTAATLAAGLRRPHAGAWLAVGHGIVEFPLMVLIMLGAGALMKTRGFQVGVGLVGGLVLLAMAALMLVGLRRPPDPAAAPRADRPLLTGILVTGGNPYFLVWWATVGLALATKALDLGILAFGLFALVHWLCDFVWLEVLSLAGHSGVKLFGPKLQTVIQVVCALAMTGFGIWFVYDAGRGLWAV